jgi:hypothetical protein
MAHPAQVETAECRQCCSFCDRVLLPSGCVESGCPYLYLYDDERSGRRFMGCLNKVFKVEIDMELFREAERTRHGFGGVKLTGAPTARCRTAVERAYHGCGDAFDCINPGFFDAPGPEPAPEFDLRDRL